MRVLRTSHQRLVAGVGLVVLATSAVALSSQAEGSPDRHGPKHSVAAQAGLVQADGSPRAGYNPVNQPQTSLGEAANRPHVKPAVPKKQPGKVDGSVGVNPDAAGVNGGNKKQAAGVKGKVLRPVRPEQVLSDASRSGGCTPGYGGNGECLPVVPPSHASHAGHDMAGAWTCAEVRTLLPDGIAVQKPNATARKKDRLGLDSNGDGIACGEADR